MNITCCICNKTDIYQGENLHEDFICSKCGDKGYRFCKIDSKIFNLNKTNFSEFKIENIQYFPKEKLNMLDKVNTMFLYNSYCQKEVCSNNCYNILYLNECIKELEMHLSLKEEGEENPILKECSRKVCPNDNVHRDYINSLKNKIKELEEYKKNYK